LTKVHIGIGMLVLLVLVWAVIVLVFVVALSGVGLAVFPFRSFRLGQRERGEPFIPIQENQPRA
jgi:hypothetical protein